MEKFYIPNIIISILLCIGITSVTRAQSSIQPSGLEMSDYKKLGLDIEIVSSYGTLLNLDRERAYLKCKTKFDQFSITLIDPELAEATLKVNINIEDFAYHVGLDFSRMVSYSVKKKGDFHVYGITWHRSTTGTHQESAGVIMLALDELLDNFLEEYVKTNQ
ncbi:MAG: hypothetical protein P8Y60_10700 [Calditrichota bacterium]